jgi:hypothetical protein
MPVMLIPLFAIVFLFSTIVAIVVISLRYKARKLEHDEIMKALEQGREVPTLEVRRSKNKDGDLKVGVILLTTGLGLHLFLKQGVPDMQKMAGIGFIPVFIGAGLITLWFILNRNEEKKD